MTRIVTTHYRYKPPPRKRKAVPLAGPAVVTPKRKQAVPLTVEPMPSRPAIVRKTKPCNDNRPKPEPVLPPTGEKKSAHHRAEAGEARRARHDAGGAPAARRRRQRAVPRDEAPSDRQGSTVMAARTPPQRHWRSYGDDTLPSGQEALDEPFAAFPSWFMRVTCDRCGKDRMLNEAHTPQRELPIRAIIAKMRHDGCGGRAGKVELLTGIEGVSSRPVRRIVLISD